MCCTTPCSPGSSLIDGAPTGPSAPAGLSPTAHARQPLPRIHVKPTPLDEFPIHQNAVADGAGGDE
jgi:hypothetical protein